MSEQPDIVRRTAWFFTRVTSGRCRESKCRKGISFARSTFNGKWTPFNRIKPLETRVVMVEGALVQAMRLDLADAHATTCTKGQTRTR